MNMSYCFRDITKVDVYLQSHKYAVSVMFLVISSFKAILEGRESGFGMLSS